ncbi:MAG: hypothetical protein K2U26_09660 [Cyclobacteriaceae bacterium]|nr:hypothetical protein [Cyclobacteriaceae bacterium]
MKRYNPYYYLLFVLVIFGAFASMAQNDYGIKILGGAAFAFAVIFALQLLYEWRKKKAKDWVMVSELIGVVLISIILGMRVFYLRFPFVEVVFGVAGLMVIVSYAIRVKRSWTSLHIKNNTMAVLVVLFLGSITCYFASMTLIPFIPFIAEPLGAVGFMLLILFVVGALWKNQLLVQGERLTAFAYVSKVRDRSLVLAALFVLFTAYTGLTSIGFIPKMYSNEFPQRYFELVQQAATGKEKPIDGRYRHEIFKEKFDQFVKRQVNSSK